MSHNYHVAFSHATNGGGFGSAFVSREKPLSKADDAVALRSEISERGGHSSSSLVILGWTKFEPPQEPQPNPVEQFKVDALLSACHLACVTETKLAALSHEQLKNAVRDIRTAADLAIQQLHLSRRIRTREELWALEDKHPLTP